MSVADAEELQREQDHVDRTWHARERSRARLAQAPGASAGGKAAAAVAKAARRAAEQLGDPDEPVVIGRVDRSEGDVLYIGKHAVLDDERDVLVVSWKADAASAYFEATVDDSRGIARKRTFDMECNKVRSFDDVVFAELAARVEALTQHEQWGIDDAVLRDLDAGRTGEMRDIVATIHAAQYELVRAPLDRLLVVQGGPGTGKTVVALHRVSWLLYQHRETLAPDDVLVIGPNPTFTRYIRSVLPGLGDSDVAHRDLRHLGPAASSARAEAPAVARLKGDARMAHLIARAMAQRVRFPDRLDVLEVPVGQGVPVALDRATVAAELRTRLAAAPSYVAGRAAMRTWLQSAVGSRVRWGTRVPATAVDAALERIWPSLSAASFLQDLLSSRERLLLAAGDDFTAAEVQLLVRGASDRLSEETWTDADVTLLDEAESLLTGQVRAYAHVVLHEAQDLSPMQLRSVRRRCPAGSLTVVGDLAQSTGLWARDTWDDVIAGLRGDHPVQVEQLLLGYRVPQQVHDLAARLLPTIAPGLQAPSVVRPGPADPDLRRVDGGDVPLEAVRAARDHAGRGLFVGIVCPSAVREELEAALRRAGVSYTDTRAGSLGTSINVVAPADAKGLEFDAVVVVEPEDVVADGEQGLRLLYVALTRTTRYLTVVHSRSVLRLDMTPDAGTPALAGQYGLFPDLDPQLSLLPDADEVPDDASSLLGALPPPEVQPLPEAPRAAPTSGVADAVTRAVAHAVAEQIRAVLRPSSYDTLLDELRAALAEEPR